ncbi:hypothetical protein BA059_16735 [Mycolicibacterium sp. (ex Dasyatis americana)]|nr:hypothetical protein BA059_16735 [Mycolicibacterium sp. (ex Dasyatis americana)]
MTVWIVNQRTGSKAGPFDTYVEAAEFRRNVLRPRLGPNEPCPFAIRSDEQPSTVAEVPGQLELFGATA